MKINCDFKLIKIEKDGTEFKFLESGDVFEICSGNIMINLFRGTNLTGSMNNIYIRLYKDEKIYVNALLGINSNSNVSYDENSILFDGKIMDIDYKVRFTLFNKNIWFYEVDIFGNDCEFDLLFCQDVGIANKSACLSNELYTSQYIDHKILENENGYVVCSRQNQDQNGKFPYVEHGCLNSKIISYSTDQTQFFSKEYKEKNLPRAIYENLEGEVYQFELSHVALQTQKINLCSHKNISFYGLFKENYESEVCEFKFENEIKECFKEIGNLKNNFKSVRSFKIRDEFSFPISSEKFSENEIDEIYSEKRFAEYKDNELISFFTKEHSHVVLKNKEIICERPHGNIILGNIDKEGLNTEVISSTNYMFGVFGSQVVLGNTSLNKMISVNRGLLNVLKNSGQRIYVKICGKFRLLTLAGIYEMGLNFSKWYYKIGEDILIIKSYSILDYPEIILEVESKNNVKYEFIVTNQIVIGENEFETFFEIYENGDEVRFYSSEGSFLKSIYENISYRIKVLNCEFDIVNDEIFFTDNVSRDKSLINFKIKESNKFSFIIGGSFEGEFSNENYNFHFDFERNRFNKFYEDLLNGFEVYSENFNYELEKLNEIIYFYAHNAMIHFLSPHGLEQSGGAAWGTRDISQGAIEFFTATNNYKIIREIILKIFSHQFKENGEWPQWFMFDKYNMQQNDFHGDIIFWPLKILAEYVELTGDESIFYEMVMYRSFPNCEIKGEENIYEHVKRAIFSIKNRFIDGTYLINYGGGDWNDTLQPIKRDLKERLVSSWTMALAYESFNKLFMTVRDEELKFELRKLCNGIKKDFLKFCVKDNVISGFIYLNKNGDIDYLIHPLDSKTGVKYRLLSLTRSIISEIVDFSQAKINNDLIEKHLKFNDGVRLLDNVIKYNGGISKIFVRAERASNVGREISLQYNHAYIRYIEAMCKISDEKNAWEGIFKINPIKINDIVKNSDYRQSNCYFSSFDGDFKTRYEFEEKFLKLKCGDVKVKGGWRIYSSGSGIFINQIVRNLLGVRETRDKIIFDPVVLKEFGKLIFKYKILNHDVKIIYNIGDKEGIQKIILNGEEIETFNERNIYRNNFKSVLKNIFKRKLKNGENIVEINF